VGLGFANVLTTWQLASPRERDPRRNKLDPVRSFIRSLENYAAPFFFLVVLGFELKASFLLDRLSTA
jgi:hypothetical protein